MCHFSSQIFVFPKICRGENENQSQFYVRLRLFGAAKTVPSQCATSAETTLLFSNLV